MGDKKNYLIKKWEIARWIFTCKQMCYPRVIHKGSYCHPALYSYQITIQKSDWSLIEVRFIKTSALIAALLKRSFLNT